MSTWGHRLSPQQRYLWEMGRYQPQHCAQCVILLEGRLSPDSVEVALRQVMARHEILRTTFPRREGLKIPAQVIGEGTEPLWAGADFQSMAEAERHAAIERALQEQRDRPFDYENGPLVDALLLRVGADRHLLSIRLPSLSADSLTLALLVQEMSRFMGKSDNDAGDEITQYLQFSEWQNDIQEDRESQVGLEYWQKRFSLAYQQLNLPFATGEEGVVGRPFFTVTVETEPDLVERLEMASARQGVSVAAFLLACWQSQLSRLCGQEEVIIDYVLDGRKFDALRSALGLFARSAPLYARLAGASRFADVLRRADQTLREFAAWQEYFVSPDRGGDTGGNGVRGAAFEYLQLQPAMAVDGLRLSLHGRYVGWDDFKMKLLCRHEGAALIIDLICDAASIREDEARCLAGQFSALLKSVLRAPNVPIKDLAMVGDEEWQWLLDFNDTATRRPEPESVLEMFEQQAAKQPDAIAVIFEHESLSYSQLNARANRLALRLRDLGVGPETPVALLLERSLEMVVSLLAVLKAGGAYVPLDTRQPKQRLNLLLDEIQARAIVTHERLIESAAGRTEPIVIPDLDLSGIERDEKSPVVRWPPETVAYVLFTSGSTGAPKAVMVERRQLSNYVQSAIARIGETSGASFAMISTFAADLGNTVLFASLCGGGCLHLLSNETATDAEAFAKYFGDHWIDCLKIVPSHLSSLIGAASSANVLPRKALVLGGETSSWRLIDEILELSPECRILNHYGPTETTVGVLTYELQRENPRRTTAGMPLGRPLNNCRVYLLDDELRQAPTWAAGDLYIGGASVARGYMNLAGLTAERFVADPMSGEPGGRLYRTGDLARFLPDGSLEFLGRSDHQVKLRGFRVELGEIEGHLRRHTQIKNAVVCAPENSSGERQIIAYVVPSPGSQPAPAELQAFLQELLPDYMIPSHYLRLESLPLTSNGKVDRNALPAPQTAGSDQGHGFISPRGLGEELLAALWREVLNVKQISIHDNFFRLGGDSLLATQLVSRVRKTFEVELPVKLIFDAPTISEFAPHVERSVTGGDKPQLPPIVRVDRGGVLPLSFAQERLWGIHQLQPDSPAYNSIAFLRLDGALNIPALEKSLNQIVARHESLRTTFSAVDGEPRQLISPPAPISLQRIELEHLPGAEREQRMMQVAGEEAHRPFDLGSGPLARVTLVKLDAQSHVILFTMHHIITDRWSLSILVKDLSSLYDAFCLGVTPRLPELPVQYADFAHWQRRQLKGERIEKLTAYWTRQLSGAPEILNLPTDYPRPHHQTFHGSEIVLLRSPESMAALKKLSAKEGVTLFMTLLSAFYTLLHRYTNQDDIVVGTDIANRNQVETEGLIGFFVNNLPLRCDLSDNPTFRELLARVRTMALDAYAHQDLPFATMVKSLRPKRSLSHTPLFQVLFILQNTPRIEIDLKEIALSLIEPESRISKLDLSLFVTETEDGLVENWVYSSELFKRETILQMAAGFKNLLQSIVQQPDAVLSKLKIFDQPKGKKRLEKVDRDKPPARRTGQPKPQPAGLARTALVRSGLLADSQPLPLLLEPNLKGVDLAEWVAGNRDFIESRLHQHGALLFRGFGVNSISEFESVAQNCCRELFGEYGDLPREQQGHKVYQSTPYPEGKYILFHNESSHMHRWPMKQFFYCVKAAEQGGETPLVDCRRIYAALPADILEQFEKKRLRYVRNFTERLDVSWQDFFKTSDPAHVEQFCREASMEIEWKGQELRIQQNHFAVTRHPSTGEKVFFNQIQLHHISCLDPDVREALLSIFGPENLPRNVCYGDGSPLEDSTVQKVIDVYWQNAVSFPWRQGDILMLDNMLVAHARKPFTGARKIVVALGDMFNRSQL